MSMIIGMEYHIQQVPMYCRVCGLKTREKPNTFYHCKVFSAELKIAFSIDTSGDDARIQPESFCICCRHSMQRITKGLRYKCAVIPFSSLSMRKRNARYRTIAYNHIHVYEITMFLQVCEHFKMCAHGYVRRSTVSSGRRAGITPNLLITHLWKIAPSNCST